MQLSGPIVVRGGGDLATGTICRLHRCGFRVLVLETGQPTAIRRTVALAEAVYEGNMTVEDVTAERIATIEACTAVWSRRRVPLLVDPEARCLQQLRPLALIDAILAKKNCGTAIDMADITIALGPGFQVGKDVHAVIETRRGHDLGRLLLHGTAAADSGVPGAINGCTTERVLYAPLAGRLTLCLDIGTRVNAGDPVARIEATQVLAPIDGIVRGMLREQVQATKGQKIADIDPRVDEENNCRTISDKARCISGGVLEALLTLSRSETSQRS